MSEPSNRRVFPLLGAAWIALAVLHGILQVLAPRGVISDGLLPFWARASLLATEGTVLAVLLVLLAFTFRLLRMAGDRIPTRLRPAVLGLRSLLGAIVLIGLASSWGTFWLSGQFLDRQGLQ